MALSTHWEWRGFGNVSQRFVEHFGTLPPLFGNGLQLQKIVDEYLWVPGLGINLKFRQGAGSQDGLKFKRLNASRNGLEKWTEAPEEIFPFPLQRPAWNLLQKEMGIPQSAFHPPAAAGRAEAIRFLQLVEPRTRTVVVSKIRRAATSGENGCVKVELAEIMSPSKTTSVGLEIWRPFEPLDDAKSTAQLHAALAELELARESLETMNYLEFIRRSVE